MENELLNLKNSAVSLILEAKSKDELEEIKLAFLGRSGSLTQILKRLPQVPTDERPRIGRASRWMGNRGGNRGTLTELALRDADEIGLRRRTM